MSVLAAAMPLLRLLPEAEFDIDDDGYVTSHHWLWPEKAEIIYGGLASIIVIAVLVKFGGPAMKKGMAARTERIQGELDASSQARADAEAEAARIRQALGDIGSERQRLLADADEQAERLLADGRERLAAEVSELETKADADIAAAGSRVTDELRAEIARLAAAAADRVVERSVDDQERQRLVEDFIAHVGAGAPA